MKDYRIKGNGTIDEESIGNLDIDGTGVIEKDLKAEDINVDGIAKFAGSVNAKSINIDGVSKFYKDIKCEEMNVKGVSKIAGNLDSDLLTIQGIVKISGDINAEELKMSTRSCVFNNIYGNTITCKHVGERTSKYYNEANEIEANTIKLENFKAKRVAGMDVTIGKNCVIDILEFSNSLEIHKDAQVKKIIKG